MERQRFFNLVAGSPGAGKSTFTAEFVKKYAENALVYKHITNIDDRAFSFLPEKTTSNWRQGAHPGAPVKCKIAGLQEDYIGFLKWVVSSYRNGLLIIDDATIFERDRLSKEMNFLVSMRRQIGVDLWLVYHGLSLLPIEQFVFVNNIIIFNCNDNIDYKANKMPQFQALKTAVSTARANFQSTDPRIKHTPAIVRLA